MAACDYDQFVTSGAPYTASNLGGARQQKAFLVWALLTLNGGGTSNGSIANQIKNGPPSAASDSGALPTFKNANDDQVTAGLINAVLAAAIRNSINPPSTVAGKVALAKYLYGVDDHLLNKLFAAQLCAFLSTAVP